MALTEAAPGGAGGGLAPPRHPPPRHSSRLPGPDVTRAVALIGVVVMNYHGFLNGGAAAAQPGDGFAVRLFDPWRGVLGTRFAATFMLVAGVGVTLMTARSRASGDRRAMSDDRWRLARRGLVLYAGGFLLAWIWPGTILFYYGAAFVVAALVCTWRSWALVLLGAASALAAAGVAWWATWRTTQGRPPAWLLSPGTLERRSPRGLLFDTFVNGTHPLLPWLAFLCAGMVLGRVLPRLAAVPTAAVALGVTALTYLVSHLATREAGPLARVVLSTRPFDRGLLYTLGTLGTAVAAFCLLTAVAQRWPVAPPVRALGAAGRLSLSIYLAHVFVFRLLVDVADAVPVGLGQALGLAATFWVVAVAVAAWWDRFVGMGPAERLYRRLGG